MARIAREGPQFLDRAEADPVCLAQGAVDGSRLSDAHLSAMDQRGHIGGVGVPVANEASRTRGLVYSCLEDPSVVRCIAQVANGVRMNSVAMIFLRHA